MIAGVQAQAEYEGQDGVLRAHPRVLAVLRRTVAMVDSTHIQDLTISPQTMLKATTVEVLLTKNYSDIEKH